MMTAPSRQPGPKRARSPAQPTWSARDDIGDFEPPWADFTEFFAQRADDRSLAVMWHLEGTTTATWTGAQWHAEARTIAGLLARAGVQTGDEVAIVARNAPSTLLTAFASWCLGAVFVPLDPRDPGPRTRDILNACTSPWLITEPAINGPAEDQRVRTISAAELFGSNRSDIEATAGTDTAPALDVPALRLHTSGTSGPPKPIVLTMRSLLVNCAAMRQAFEWDQGTRALTVLPVSHANGLVISSLLPWFAGGSSVLVDQFRASTFWWTAHETGATTCSLVPTVMEYLLAAAASHDSAPGHEPPTLREVFSGSGPMRPTAADEFEDRFGVPVRQLYGLSETSAVLTVTPRAGLGDSRSEFRVSVGPTVPYADVRVIQPDGSACAENERGEIVTRGGMLMLGYHGLPEATAQAFDGGWFHTGDRGYYRRGPDGRPWFFLEGRAQEAISRAGSTILPHYVDQVLEDHPAVERAATVGFPNRWYGFEVAAAVIRRTPVDAEELIAWCRDRLSFDAAPKVIVFEDHLPVTTVGKIRRGLLAEQLAPLFAQHWERQFRPDSRPPDGGSETQEGLHDD